MLRKLEKWPVVALLHTHSVQIKDSHPEMTAYLKFLDCVASRTRNNMQCSLHQWHSSASPSSSILQLAYKEVTFRYLLSGGS